MEPPPQPSACGLHPGVAVTGFCPACLRERLAGLPPTPADLRRCKSFSYCRSAAAYTEPHRRSCDARPERQIGGLGRPMKEHITQESSASSSRKTPGTLGALGKRFQQWRHKSKLKKQGPPELDPRLSVDYSPRASCDAYHGGRRLPPMLSVVEDVPVPRYDGQIPVEEDDDDAVPGGTSQTRDYYLDSSSSSRRRRSLDRKSFSDASELPRMIAGANANARVSPAIGVEFYHYHHSHSVFGHQQHQEQEQGLHSLRDDASESFDSAFRDHGKAGAPTKKPNRWIKGWNIWGLLHKKSSTRESEADRSFSESWPELRARGYNGQMLRCNSSVSARSSFSAAGSAIGASGRRSNVEMHVNGLGRMRRDEVLLERNLSARYSSYGADNGMIPPPLDPVGGSQFSRRSQNGMSGKGRTARSSNLLPRSTLGLY